MVDEYEQQKVPGLTRKESQEYRSLQDRIEDTIEDGDPAEVDQADLRQFFS